MPILIKVNFESSFGGIFLRVCSMKINENKK